MSAWALIPMLAQAGVGIWQYYQGRKLAEETTPAYEIPAAATQATELQRRRMLSDMPGEQTMREDVRAGTAGQLAAAERYGYIDPNVVGQTYAGEQAGMRQIGVMGAQHRDRQADMYLNMLGQLGGYQQAGWEWDVAQPHLAQMGAAYNLMGSGMQQVYGAMGSGATYMGYRDIYGNKPVDDTTTQTGTPII